MTATYEERAASGSTVRRLKAPLVVAAGAVAACAYVYAADPTDGGAFIPCPLRELTGLWCPGCGLTRATYHVLQGDLVGALGRNLLLPAIAVVAVWAWLAWALGSVGRPTRSPSSLPKTFWILFGVAALAFGIVRNLPFGAALAP